MRRIVYQVGFKHEHAGPVGAILTEEERGTHMFPSS